MTTFQRMLQVLSAPRGVVASGLAATRQPIETRQRAARKKTRASKQLAAGVQPEQLEQRLAMAINIFAPVVNASFPDWFVITSDGADDVYIQQTATVPQDLLIADNASFNDPKNLRAFHADGKTWNGIDVYKTMYATNATPVSVSGMRPNEGGLTTTFVLSDTVEPTGPVIGSVRYGGNAWGFNNGVAGVDVTFELPSTSPTAASDPNLIFPTSGTLFKSGDVWVLGITWSSPPLSSAGILAAPSVPSITYANGPRTLPAPFPTTTDTGLTNASGSRPTLQLPVTATNPGGIVPGTLSGSLTVDGFRLPFRIEKLFPVGPNLLLFGNEATPSATNGIVLLNRGTPNEISATVSAEVFLDSGIVQLEFTADGNQIDPGSISLSANYAVYNQDAASNSFTFAQGQTFSKRLIVDQLSPGSAININSPILQATTADELTLRGSTVNLNAPVQGGEYIDIGAGAAPNTRVDRSPIVGTASAFAIVGSNGRISAIGVPSGQGGQGYDDSSPLAIVIAGGGGTGATANAFSTGGMITRIDVTNPGSGYTSLPSVTIPAPLVLRFPTLSSAIAEQVNFNAPVSAPNFDLRIGDDPGTLATNRGLLFVSSSGSLEGLGGMAARSVYAEADGSDIVVEGKINATNQSYLLRSPDVAGPLAPFVFSTTSPRTGAGTGLIQGGTVAVTLGNDVLTTEQSSIASNTVDLRTHIDSLRITAATRKGGPMSGPFPYDLTVNQINVNDTVKTIAFDAVAASGRGISLTAAGNIRFNAGLATWGDLSVTSGGDFNVTAPLSTARGQIAITANALTVGNSVRVLDSAFDTSRDDITLTATGGDLSLTGAIAAVNNVRLIQRNKAGQPGKISGPSRIVANGASVEAEGSATLRTDVVTLSGRSAGDFAIDELNDISITSLRAPGLVTLRAAGTDPGTESSFSPNPIALTATLYDVTSLDVSAPRGSVNVTSDTSKTLTLGNPAAIAGGTATSMQAAGKVTIRSLAGPVVVADAPVGGGNAITTRFAFVADLLGIYNPGISGLFASTLTGAKAALVSEEGVPLSVGDRILLKGQANSNQNGVYVVTVSGSAGRNWVLTRAPDADMSNEMLAGGFVRVLEGLYADAVYSIDYDPARGASPLAVSMVPNRAGAEPVRVATTSTLAGSYDAGMATISAPGSLPLIDGVSLSVGDRVLVRLGTADSLPGGTGVTPLPVSTANGVYEVVSVGGVAGTWSLARATNLDSGSAIETGYVLTTEGSYRAAITGQAFAVTYDSLGIDPLSVTPLLDADYPGTDIGTEDINDVTTFVVSSTAGSNTAAGSLGKMISLRQGLDAVSSSSSLNPTPKIELMFSSVLPGLNGSAAGSIRLTQELPAISKAFAINGANRLRLAGVAGAATGGITIDGSRITTSRTGQPAATAAEVNGFEFVTGSQSTVGAAGGSLSNVTVGGFAKGAAVKINGVGGIHVTKTVLGRSGTGDRLANKFGILASGNQAEGTVSGSTIVGSTHAGIRTELGASGLTIVGTTVGAANQGNVAGIELTAGSTSVGLNPVVAPRVAVRTVRDQTSFVLPAVISTRSLHLGQIVSGPGIAAGTTIAAIHRQEVTLSKAMTATAVRTGIRFAAPARNTVQFNLMGLKLLGGNNTVTNTTVGSNVYDGILIQGGTQTIGTARKRSNLSNAIFGNGQYGVRVDSGTALTIATIQGNNFGVQGRNQGGNVSDNGAVDVARYKPNARTRFDINGNFHAKVVTAAAKRRITWR